MREDINIILESEDIGEHICKIFFKFHKDKEIFIELMESRGVGVSEERFV